MTKRIARLRARLAGGDRGAATLDVGLAAIRLGVTVVAAVTRIGGDLTTW